MRFDDSSPCHPPLDGAARAAAEEVPGGRAFVLALASVVCNSLHRHDPAPRAVDCSTCRHETECRRQMEASLAFTAGMTASRFKEPGERGG